MQKKVDCNKQDIGNNRMIAVLAYLGVLAVVLFLMEKKSEIVRFHTGQGITLLVMEIVYGIVYQLLAVTVWMISWRLYFIVRIVGCMAWVFPVLALIGIINVVNGQEKELPVIGKIRVIR